MGCSLLYKDYVAYLELYMTLFPTGLKQNHWPIKENVQWH